MNDAVMEVKRMEDIGLIGTDMDGHVVVVGFSPVARSAIAELLDAGRSVAVLCQSAEEVPLARRLQGFDRDGMGRRGLDFMETRSPFSAAAGRASAALACQGRQGIFTAVGCAPPARVEAGGGAVAASAGGRMPGPSVRSRNSSRL